MSEMSEESIDRCINGNDAPCECACPFHLNIRDFLDRIQRGNFGSAFNLYHAAVVFPGIVSRICAAPCAHACSNALKGDPIRLIALERAAAAYARSTDPVNFNLLKKQGRIAVVGAGLSGLACALRLGSKGYSVTIYEQSDAIAASLERYLDRSIFEGEIRKQFQFVSCEFRMDTKVHSAAELSADAIYVPAGVEIEGGNELIFSGESSLGPIGSIASGSDMAEDIEWFLQTGRRRQRQAAPRRREDSAPQNLESGPEYTKAEARDEASRCPRCDCSACMKECALLRMHGATPRELAKEVGLSLHLFPETQGRAAMREIGSCNFCGLCERICPVHVNIGRFLLRARTELFKMGTLPPAHHEYWIRDMAFANSEEAALLYQPQGATGGYMFFPGCQAGGSDPRYVSLTYSMLLKHAPGTSLLLRCCGAPAQWAGDAESFKKELGGIESSWEQAGRPTVLLSCPSCYRIFHEHLPRIPIKPVYDLLEPVEGTKAPFPAAAVFDPCASRDFPELQATIRRLAKRCGVRLEELRNSGERAQCCSWGGHGYAVNPVFVDTLAREQASQSDLPYIVYCSNCRDIFSAKGKDCRHILDLVLGINRDRRDAPTTTERRANRRELRSALISDYAMPFPALERKPRIRLVLDKCVSKKASDALILEEDIAAIIERSEKEGNYLLDRDSGRCICHRRLGLLTYWVEFTKDADGGYRVHNAYSHRMSIKAECGQDASRS